MCGRTDDCRHLRLSLAQLSILPSIGSADRAPQPRVARAERLAPPPQKPPYPPRPPIRCRVQTELRRATESSLELIERRAEEGFAGGARLGLCRGERPRVRNTLRGGAARLLGGGGRRRQRVRVRLRSRLRRAPGHDTAPAAHHLGFSHAKWSKRGRRGLRGPRRDGRVVRHLQRQLRVVRVRVVRLRARRRRRGCVRLVDRRPKVLLPPGSAGAWDRDLLRGMEPHG